MKVAIGADHAGYDLKVHLVAELELTLGLAGCATLADLTPDVLLPDDHVK